MTEDLKVALSAATKRAEDAEKALQPPDSWYGEGEAVALAHGFTKEQYRAAKAIEYRIFGFYQWQNQGDRAASMMVQICQAIKDATAAAESSLQEALAREAGKDAALEPFAEIGQWLFARPEVPDDEVMVEAAGINGYAAPLTRGHFKAAHSALSTPTPHPWGEVVRAAEHFIISFWRKGAVSVPAIEALDKAVSALPTSAAPSDTAVLVEAGRQWQSMRTAPYNKTMVALIHVGERGYVKYGIGWYMPLTGWQGWCPTGDYVPPTHWVSLPEPPNANWRSTAIIEKEKGDAPTE